MQEKPEEIKGDGRHNKGSFVSLAVKNAVAYSLLTLIGFALLGVVLFRYSAGEIVASSEQQVEQASKLVEVKFASFIQNVRRDIVFLAQSPFLRDFVQNSEEGKRQLLSAEYLALLRSKPDYAQIRLIGVHDNGTELIRVERIAGQTILVADEDLQEKGERPYFLETMRLPEDSVYLSAIDLNKEYGAISTPRMPTLRMATPIFRGDTAFGIVIINVNLEPLFDELSALVDSRFDLKIINQDGYFLLHPEEALTFGFEYERPPAFAQDFGLSLKEAQRRRPENTVAAFADQELLYLIKPLFYPREAYQLFAAVGATKNAILADFYAWRKNIFLSALGLVVLILLIILVYMRRQADELLRITETMTAYPGSAVSEELPVARNDEIGRLARRFREMSAAIEEHISSLQVAKKKVEEAVKEKETFLENMSHEIRNPIHSIIGMTHLLEKNNPGRHQQAFVESLKFNASNLLSLVNDILDYKKLSKGQLTFHPDWQAVRTFLQQILISHQYGSAKKGIELKLEVDPKLDQFLLWFDPVRLTQVVNNLVINALKFTPENGQIVVAARLVQEGVETIRVSWKVKDNGIGIPKAEMDQIKQRFYAHDYATDGIAPGSTGLGLPIVIQLLKMFNSHLHIDSIVGQGSEFCFELELPAQPQLAERGLEREQLPEGILMGAKLLILDDDPLMNDLYDTIFSPAGPMLSKYQHPVELPAKGTYDLVIADFYFGQDTLLDHLDKLSRVLKPDTILFVLSGTEKLPVEITKLPQFQGHILKPVDPQSMVQSLQLIYASQHYGIPDTSAFWKDYDGDEEKYRRAIKLLIQEWSQMTRDLDQALLTQDMKAYLAIRHKLITSVRRLGLSSFEQLLDLPLVEKARGLAANFRERLIRRLDFYLWWLRWKV